MSRGTERRSSGQSGPARAGNLVPELLIPEAMTQPDAAFVVAHSEARDVSMIMATLDALAISQLMLDLCSAPCKARRFAPPARARGLRALTVPARRSCLGLCVMAGDECRDRRSGARDL
jgi:hypothetical protein